MTVIKQYNTGTSTWEPIVSGVQGPAGSWSSPQTIVQMANPYTISNSNIGSICILNDAGVVTINTAIGMTAGQKIDFISLAASGTVVSFAASGVGLFATPGLKLRTQYSAATLICLTSTLYVLMGDLIA